MRIKYIPLFKLCSIITLTLLVSCEVPYDNNARLLIKGQLLDENDLPISGGDVEVYVRGEGGIGGNAVNLGTALSDGSGSFKIITLLGRDDNFVIEVEVNEDYTTYQYRTNLEEFTPTDYLIDLGLVPIKSRATLNYNIERTSPEGTEFEYRFEFESTECKQVYIEEELVEEESRCFLSDIRSDILNDENPTSTSTIQTTLGSDVFFTYSINGQPEITQQITLDQLENAFNFEY